MGRDRAESQRDQAENQPLEQGTMRSSAVPAPLEKGIGGWDLPKHLRGAGGLWQCTVNVDLCQRLLLQRASKGHPKGIQRHPKGI